MIITKKALPRRTFLQGAGVVMALPLLEAMVPSMKAAAASPRRLGFVYIPNGFAITQAKGINYWQPKGQGANFEISPILSPLSAFQDQMTVVSGLAQHQAFSLGDGNGDHVRSTATWLNGVHPKFTQGSDVRAGVTADQIAATHLGKETPLASLELGIDVNFLVGNCENGYSCIYLNSLAWRTPTTPLPTETNPRALFERLFGDGGAPAQRQAQMRNEKSILDAVTQSMNQLVRRLGSSDRVRAEEYFDSVREVEQRIQKTEARSAELNSNSAESLVEQPPIGVPEVYGDHVKLMFDLQWLAFQADKTRVFSFMYGRENSSRQYPEIGFFDSHHGVSHHGDNPEQLLKYSKLNTYHASLFAYFLDKMRNTPEADGNLLDHSLILFGAGMSNPNIHSHLDIPLALLGGANGQIKGNRHLVFAPEKEVPMTNLLVTMLGTAGVPVEKLGDSTGGLPGIT
jgi:hypothetical protein